MVERIRPSNQQPESGRRRVGRPRVRKIERKYPKNTQAKDQFGRPKGSPNKISERIRAMAAAEGELPHEFALRIMRLGVGYVLKGPHGSHTIDWEDVKWAVHLAAPYFGARLTSIRVSGHDGGPQKIFHIDPAQLAKCTPAELEVLEKFFGARVNGNGHANGNGGPAMIEHQPMPAPGEVEDIESEDDDDYERSLH